VAGDGLASGRGSIASSVNVSMSSLIMPPDVAKHPATQLVQPNPQLLAMQRRHTIAASDIIGSPAWNMRGTLLGGAFSNPRLVSVSAVLSTKTDGGQLLSRSLSPVEIGHRLLTCAADAEQSEPAAIGTAEATADASGDQVSEKVGRGDSIALPISLANGVGDTCSVRRSESASHVGRRVASALAQVTEDRRVASPRRTSSLGPASAPFSYGRAALSGRMSPQSTGDAHSLGNSTSPRSMQQHSPGHGSVRRDEDSQEHKASWTPYCRRKASTTPQRGRKPSRSRSASQGLDESTSRCVKSPQASCLIPADRSETRNAVVSSESPAVASSAGCVASPASVASVVDVAKRTATATSDLESNGNEVSRGASEKRSGPRTQGLYEDHEMRQRRWLKRFDEKRRQEETEVEQNLQLTKPQRSYDPSSFEDWYSMSLQRHTDAERRRVEVQQEQERRRSAQELSACTFAPKPSKVATPSATPSATPRGRQPPTSTRAIFSASAGAFSAVAARAAYANCVPGAAGLANAPAATSSPAAVSMAVSTVGTTSAAGASPSQSPRQGATGLSIASSPGEAAPQPLSDVYVSQDQLIADELIAQQVVQIRKLRLLDQKASEQRSTAQRDALEDLAHTLAENSERIERFAVTTEGTQMLQQRGQDYLELNPGMDSETALQEAREDLVQASEAKLRSRAAAELRLRAQEHSQHIQLARLQSVRELIRIQARYESLLLAKAVPQHCLASFDPHLVRSLKQEPWYSEARAAAERGPLGNGVA